jgi:hypothetical protein
MNFPFLIWHCIIPAVDRDNDMKNVLNLTFSQVTELCDLVEVSQFPPSASSMSKLSNYRENGVSALFRNVGKL